MALREMKSGKEVGPDDIPVEAWRYLVRWQLYSWLVSLMDYSRGSACQKSGRAANRCPSI